MKSLYWQSRMLQVNKVINAWCVGVSGVRRHSIWTSWDRSAGPRLMYKSL